jgi:uncharacterized RDD family membrane protein YckC
MQIYLARNNQQAGPYTVEQLNQMLASQQVLLTDLTWHQGMSEWKALGELTQGQLAYYPPGYVATETTTENTPFNPNPNNPTIQHVEVKRPTQAELASIPARIGAKFIDLLLWLPAAAIPSFFFNADQLTTLSDIQQKMQAATTSDQATQLQTQLFQLIPADAWSLMGIYVLLMLAVQAILIAKSGQSIGKKLTKIKIVDQEDNQKVSLLRGFTLRSVIFIALTFFFFPIISVVDYLFALGEKRQTLHDKLAKTKVIKQ